LEDMIDVLLEYCQKRLLLTELLQEIESFNPRQYQRYASRLAPRPVLGLLDLGPELRLLENQGFIAQDAAIPGGWRVRPQVLLWWLADELVSVVQSEQMLETWLQDQVLERPLTLDEKRQMGELGRAIADLLQMVPHPWRARLPIPCWRAKG
jgi:hypothetical protein